MTQEEKELLLKDLCARLPHGLKCFHNATQQICLITKISHDYGVCIEGRRESSIYDGGPSYVEMWTNIDSVKIYLRPMSSMTEDEYNEYVNYIVNEKDEFIKFCNSLNFYGRYHFDYRGLIEKGLALEAPEGMYK